MLFYKLHDGLLIVQPSFNIELIDSKNADAFKFKMRQTSSNTSSSRPSLFTNSSLVSSDITYAALIGRK